MAETTWKEAIIKVLEEEKISLHYSTITEIIAERGYYLTLGATPQDTVNSLISTDLNKNRENSVFIRTARGYYALRKYIIPNIAGVDPKIDDIIEKRSLINSYGIYWNREFVQWKSSPNIFGAQEIGSTPINFKSQIGIYLLHDIRETIYVGQTIKQCLGERLYQHTKERLSGRWNRFSWFGFYPVTSEGLLDTSFIIKETTIQEITDLLEAILIESIEPRQNRKQGNLYYSTEYIQDKDPAIKKNELNKMLDHIRKEMEKLNS